MARITIAGASGFIGQRLLQSLPHHYQICALARNSKKNSSSHIQWKVCDLFSSQSTVNSLVDTDVAIYLVHSMLPSSRLFQGDFHDTDLLLADNFASACVQNGVKQIIYLGGLVPETQMSPHLASRLEVEKVFQSLPIPCTILRAGMVVGEGGSSFEILRNLVFNLPAMILPKWTHTQTQVISIYDLVEIFKDAIGNQNYYHKTISVVNGEKLTYKDLIIQTCNYYQKKKLLWPLQINSTSFSKLWVSLFGETSYDLVSPLIDSLLCDLPNLEIDPLIDKHIKHREYKSMLEGMERKKYQPIRKKVSIAQINSVRSIQRLRFKSKLSATEVSVAYLNWLPKFLNFIITVNITESEVYFKLFHSKISLLVLRPMDSENLKDRIKFHIVGGLLSKTVDTGWLEFRKVRGHNIILASINEYVPSLPWFIYVCTQAPFHKYVMDKFAQDLGSREKI